MTYRVLPTHLHSAADAVTSHFRAKGVRKISVEQELQAEVQFRPTLSGGLADYHILCVEVTDSGYSDTIDAFVLDCQRRGLPVKLYVAMPTEATSEDLASVIKKAKDRGVGIIEVDTQLGCSELVAPVSLSLSGLRRVDLRRFPVKYKQGVADGEQTFLNGDPAKGCSRIYDELEALSRRIAAKATDKGWWTKKPKLKPNKGPWTSVLEALRDDLKLTALPGQAPHLSKTLLSKIIGITPHRNESGHKPKTRAQLMDRDRQLRTRFEHAVDTLEELVVAAKGLGV